MILTPTTTHPLDAFEAAKVELDRQKAGLLIRLAELKEEERTIRARLGMTRNRKAKTEKTEPAKT